MHASQTPVLSTPDLHCPDNQSVLLFQGVHLQPFPSSLGTLQAKRGIATD